MGSCCGGCTGVYLAHRVIEIVAGWFPSSLHTCEEKDDNLHMCVWWAGHVGEAIGRVPR